MRILLALLLLGFLGYSQEGNTKLKFTKLTEDLYVYTNYKLFSGTQFPSNSMYLVTNEGVVLFDTPWDETQFQPLLDSIENCLAKVLPKPVSPLSSVLAIQFFCSEAMEFLNEAT